jgi:hypothetical protein
MTRMTGMTTLTRSRLKIKKIVTSVPPCPPLAGGYNASDREEPWKVSRPWGVIEGFPTGLRVGARGDALYLFGGILLTSTNPRHGRTYTLPFISKVRTRR